MKIRFILLSLLLLAACNQAPKEPATAQRQPTPFLWDNATVYFMLTDRFHNGDTTNDQSLGRAHDGALLRNFEGGDFAGITAKLKENYFDELGVNAIWFTPPFEQVRGYTDEGTGKTYAYHGYWIRDWTTTDPNYGSMTDLKMMVDEAHARGIRVILDVVINHTGPVTATDSVWPEAWVRTEPTCQYKDFESTVTCTLVKNLPDIRTDSDEEVALPDFLLKKWEEEGRLETELAELDAFFARTGYPRAPRYYIVKWLVDMVRELGIDGFRVDTAKHTEAGVWKDLYKEANAAFAEWKKANPEAKLDDNDFYMVGEVYNYVIGHGQDFDYGDTTVNFFAQDFDALINFAFKTDAKAAMDSAHTAYAATLNTGALSGYSVLNYLSSHDDGSPYDPKREHAKEAGTLLLLSPGAAQIYYGDETARLLVKEGTVGDACLRTMMNWDELVQNTARNGYTIQEVLEHWQKLGRFRKAHPAIGAGTHSTISTSPYIFSRAYSQGDYADKVIVAIGSGDAAVPVGELFAEGTVLTDFYSGESGTVKKGQVQFDTASDIRLIAIM